MLKDVPPVDHPARIFISVAEESADVHAASLVRAARELLPGATFYGLTGRRLRAEGVATVYDLTSHAAMLGGVVGVIGRAWQALRAIEKTWRRERPDLVLLLDSPELNLRLARRARRRGVPVLYYIAPQTWAARAGRNRQIARDVDRLACILPFEEAYFRRALVQADYVGHPLFEALERESPRPEVVERLRSHGLPVVALLPGSRRHVIDAMLPRQLEVIRRMRTAGHVVQPVVSCVGTERTTQIRRLVLAGGFSAEVLVRDNASLLTAADLVLVASGTATLHVAAYRKSMIVMYDAGRTLAWPYRLLGRFVIRTPHLSLINVLAGARVVPEFMPFIPETQPIATLAGQLLEDVGWRELMVSQLDALVRPLEGSRASPRVCEIIARMLGGRGPARMS
jgi:lipid-A-disaccharide synthase